MARMPMVPAMTVIVRARVMQTAAAAIAGGVDADAIRMAIVRTPQLAAMRAGILKPARRSTAWRASRAHSQAADKPSAKR
jgi:hypothetical protein